MFELIDPSVTTQGRPLSDWIGKRLIENQKAVAERGIYGGYVWSYEAAGGTVTIIDSLPSPVSTHPDYWYSIPFTIDAQPGQTELTVRMLLNVSGQVRISLWCEGRSSALAPAVGPGPEEVVRTVELPRRLSGGDLRCAILVKSLVGTLLDTGSVESTSPSYIRVSTNIGPTRRQAANYFLVIDSSGDESEGRGWQGTRRYQVIRARDQGTHDDFEVWPSVSETIQPSTTPTDLVAEVYALGTVTFYSMSASTGTPDTTGYPSPLTTHAGKLVRAEWVRRMARFATRLYLDTPQYAWLGGVAGVERSTGNISVGQTTIPYRLWGAWVTETFSPVVLARTAVRARANVRGIIVTVMYVSSAPVELTVDYSGTTQNATLGMYVEEAQRRDTSSSDGTMHWRHAALTRDQCSSQDLGFHGAETDGFEGDTARLALARTTFLWDGVIAPTLDEIVPFAISASCADKCYIASITVREMTYERAPAWPDMSSPAVVPFGFLEDDTTDALRERQVALYETRLRCFYSEYGDPQLVLLTYSLSASTLVQIKARTSPDLPAGTVIRLTVDAARTSGIGSLDVTFGATTLSFTTRSVQTADIAVTSDTDYLLAVTAIRNSTGSGAIYLLRIEEFLP